MGGWGCVPSVDEIRGEEHGRYLGQVGEDGGKHGGRIGGDPPAEEEARRACLLEDLRREVHDRVHAAKLLEELQRGADEKGTPRGRVAQEGEHPAATRGRGGLLGAILGVAGALLGQPRLHRRKLCTHVLGATKTLEGLEGGRRVVPT